MTASPMHGTKVPAGMNNSTNASHSSSNEGSSDKTFSLTDFAKCFDYLTYKGDIYKEDKPRTCILFGVILLLCLTILMLIIIIIVLKCKQKNKKTKVKVNDRKCNSEREEVNDRKCNSLIREEVNDMYMKLDIKPNNDNNESKLKTIEEESKIELNVDYSEVKDKKESGDAVHYDYIDLDIKKSPQEAVRHDYEYIDVKKFKNNDDYEPELPQRNNTTSIDITNNEISDALSEINDIVKTLVDLPKTDEKIDTIITLTDGNSIQYPKISQLTEINPNETTNDLSDTNNDSVKV